MKVEQFKVTGAIDTQGKIRDFGVANGKIVEVNEASGPVIDASGLQLLPGLVDLHTHLREPGYEQSETIATGSKSAAMGGFTAVHAMANTFPVADTAGVVEQIARLGDEAGYVKVQPVGAVTVGLNGERLAELGAMANSKAKVRIFSDDGKCVSDPLLMRRALEYVKSFNGVIAQHAQDPRLTEAAQMNEGDLSAKLGLTGWPSVAEEAIIARDVLLAELVDSRIHICHVSTAGSVELIRWAKKRGIKVTAEVTPHHLMLTEDLVASYDAVYKVNPPLRTSEDVRAVREGLIDGTIDIIATDHAPHPRESKECEWSQAAFGMLGLETALSIAQLVLVESGLSDWSRVAEVLSINPAQISGMEDQGHALNASDAANFTLVDPSKTRTISQTQSKSTNNPYFGMELPGEVRFTCYNGVLTVADAKIQNLGGQDD